MTPEQQQPHALMNITSAFKKDRFQYHSCDLHKNRAGQQVGIMCVLIFHIMVVDNRHCTAPLG